MAGRREARIAEIFEGGCACGATRYRMRSRPMVVNCCHCRECQRQTGSAFVINALIESDRLSLISGETGGTGVPTDSGRPHVIHRCPTCRTALWSHYGSGPALSFVRVGPWTTRRRCRPTCTSIPERNCHGCDCPKARGPSRPITIRGRNGRLKASKGGAHCSGSAAYPTWPTGRGGRPARRRAGCPCGWNGRRPRPDW